VAQQRISGQGGNVEHITADGDTYRATRCDLGVPVIPVEADHAAEDSSLLKWMEHDQDTASAYKYLVAFKHTIPLGPVSDDDLPPDVLGHYVYRADDDGYPIVAIITKLCTQPDVNANSVPYCCLSPTGASGEEMFLTAELLRREWTVSAVFNLGHRNAGWAKYAAVISQQCSKCKQAERDASVWLADREARHKDHARQKKLTGGKNNQSRIDLMTPTSKLRRQNNRRKAFSRAQAQKNAANVDIRCVKGLADDQSQEMADSGAYILRHHSDVLDEIAADGMPSEPVLLPNGDVGTYKQLLVQVFMSDVQGYAADQEKGIGGTFHDSTFRLMMAVWSRCPAAHKAYRKHWLNRVPAEKTMKNKAQKGVGISAGQPQPKIVRLVKERYDRECDEEARRPGGSKRQIPCEFQVSGLHRILLSTV